jgi:glycerol-3-phosphate dehydrogenase
MAEVVHAIERESAVTLTDFMIRRSLIAFRQCEGLDCCGKVTKKMAAILHWSGRKASEQVNAYKKEIAMRHAYEKKEQPKTAPKRSRRSHHVRRSRRRRG